MLDGLDCGVVMVLVDLLVNGGGEMLMTVRLDVFIRDGLANSLVCGRPVLAIPRDEALNCLFCLFHDGR